MLTSVCLPLASCRVIVSPAATRTESGPTRWPRLRSEREAETWTPPCCCWRPPSYRTPTRPRWRLWDTRPVRNTTFMIQTWRSNSRWSRIYESETHATFSPFEPAENVVRGDKWWTKLKKSNVMNRWSLKVFCVFLYIKELKQHYDLPLPRLNFHENSSAATVWHHAHPRFCFLIGCQLTCSIFWKQSS